MNSKIIPYAATSEGLDSCFVLRLKWEYRDNTFFTDGLDNSPTQSLVATGIEGVSAKLTNWFISVEEAESYYIEQLLAKATRIEKRRLPTVHPFRINAARSHVARNSRRGNARLLLVGPKIDDKDVVNYIMMKRLKDQWPLNGPLEIVVDERIPVNTMIAVYRGTNPYDHDVLYWGYNDGYAFYMDEAIHSYALVFPITE